MKAISHFVVAELPFLPLYYTAFHLGVRKGVRAFDGAAGGAGGAQAYGSYLRNAHLWDRL